MHIFLFNRFNWQHPNLNIRVPQVQAVESRGRLRPFASETPPFLRSHSASRAKLRRSINEATTKFLLFFCQKIENCIYHFIPTFRHVFASTFPNFYVSLILELIALL